MPVEVELGPLGPLGDFEVLLGKIQRKRIRNPARSAGIFLSAIFGKIQRKSYITSGAKRR